MATNPRLQAIQQAAKRLDLEEQLDRAKGAYQHGKDISKSGIPFTQRTPDEISNASLPEVAAFVGGRASEGIEKLGRSLMQGIDKSVNGRESAVLLNPKDYSGKNLAESAVYTTGRVVGDAAGDVSRGTWWRYNHPLAITRLVSDKFAEATFGKNPTAIALTGLGATAALDLLSGNVDLSNMEEGGRPKGYSAVFASPEDPTKSEAPLAEGITRYFFGKTGKILPYEQFHQERPDISPEHYQQYKKHQQSAEFFGLEKVPVLGTPFRALGELGILKGTAAGLNGPEITGMGYRVPLDAVIGTTGLGAALYMGNKYLQGRRGRVG